MSALSARLRARSGFVAFVVFVATYAVLYVGLSFTSERAGVFLASGKPSFLTIALALTVLAMRIALLFVVVPLLTHRLVNVAALVATSIARSNGRR